jgi:hypothetical protein
LAWHELKAGEDPLAQRAAEALVDSMNKETESLRSLCAPLRLSRLAWSGRFQPHTGLLQFRKNADVDGFVADLSAHTEVSQLLYQVSNILLYVLLILNIYLLLLSWNTY